MEVKSRGLNAKVSESADFYQGNDPAELIKKFGSPLYVYSEKILRAKCRELKNMVSYPKFMVNYSTKANSNFAVLKTIKEEGLHADALSPGEMFLLLNAGFDPSEIFFVSNNVDDEEMRYAIGKKILTGVDSVSQLERFGRLSQSIISAGPNSAGKVAVRFNPGVGAGHHQKVVTGGNETKFGVNAEYIPQVRELLKKYSLKLAGINQHIGSLFMTGESYMEGMNNLLEIAAQFDDLEFIDLGGGFGIPYHKQSGETPMDIKELGRKLSVIMNEFSEKYGKKITFKVEPGRYVTAECAILLGKANAVKYNGPKKFIGTDLGFNVLARPMIYDSHHDIEIYRPKDSPAFASSSKEEKVSIVGNICESGDILARDRILPEIFEDDIIGVLDSGAYGFAMSSGYNSRLRPAEVMIKENSEVLLTRKRDTLEQLLCNQPK